MPVWIGTKQKELEAGSMQLMHPYTPWATGLLAVLGLVFEPVGFLGPTHFCYCFDYTMRLMFAGVDWYQAEGAGGREHAADAPVHALGNRAAGGAGACI